MDLGARQGAALQPDTTLFQVADLSTVWVTTEVPEAQAAWVKGGDPVQVEVQALPGRRYTGRIDYIYPELAQATRTATVRIVLHNPDGLLRPGMYVTARLHGDTREGVVTVPSEAVIRTGERNVLIIADDENHFRPVLARLGSEFGSRTEILEGVRPGDTVVASGQFLIDSEASLRGALENLTGSGTTSETTLMPSPSTGGP
jgi:Cu(I)/Ag(I) efflux system membrane fusion protein